MADEQDDLLDPAEIEALLNANVGPKSEPPRPAAGAKPGPGSGPPVGGGDVLTQTDLDALFQQKTRAQPSPASSAGIDPAGIDALLRQTPRSPGSAAGRSAEALLNQVDADLAAAISPDSPSRRLGAQLAGAKPFEFAAFESAGTNADLARLELLDEVELDLRIELGRTELLIEEVLKLREGSVVPLDKLAGDPVDILVNGRLIARGEVLVLNDNFCVRIAEILSPAF